MHTVELVAGRNLASVHGDGEIGNPATLKGITMTKFVTTSALTMAVLSVWASLSSRSSDSAWITLAATEPRTVAVYLGLPADFVSVPLRV